MSLSTFWQNIPCFTNEIAFSVGNFDIKWYSLSYIAAVLTIALLLWQRIRKNELPAETKSSEKFSQDLLDIAAASFLGALLGARLGYALFYDQSLLTEKSTRLFWPFENGELAGISGLSFHGGLAGAVLLGAAVTKYKKYSFLNIANFAIPAFPLGYFWGRPGNFLNHELFGKTTNAPIGMNFSENCSTEILRHPSQLYEALGEGLLIFAILWPLRNRKFFQKHLFALFLIFYGIIRFIIEFFRQPEIVFGWLTMGQALCLAMITIGTILIIFIDKHLPLKKNIYD